MSVLAAGAAGLALWLALPPHTRLDRGLRMHRMAWPLASALAALLLVHTLRGTRLALGLIGLGVALGVQHLVARARQAREADRLAGLVLGVCEGMAADLAAGQTPEAALARAAAEWPPLAAAATAARLGGDVPGVLHGLAGNRGAEGLRAVAAAWQVAQRAGSGLTPALREVVVGLRERRRTSKTVASELASARATAHLMALLPVGVLLLGTGVGGDPVGFLLGTTPGLCCLGLGAALALAGLFWLQHISDGVLGQ